jgi:hypothetical protein
MGHIAFTTVAGQGWLVGLAEPALDAETTLAYRPVGDNVGSAVRTAMASSSRKLARKGMADLQVSLGKPFQGGTLGSQGSRLRLLPTISHPMSSDAGLGALGRPGEARQMDRTRPRLRLLVMLKIC